MNIFIIDYYILRIGEFNNTDLLHGLTQINILDLNFSSSIVDFLIKQIKLIWVDTL